MAITWAYIFKTLFYIIDKNEVDKCVERKTFLKCAKNHTEQ